MSNPIWINSLMKLNVIFVVNDFKNKGTARNMGDLDLGHPAEVFREFNLL